MYIPLAVDKETPFLLILLAEILQLNPEQGFLQPATHFTITAQTSTGTATVDVAVDWIELF